MARQTQILIDGLSPFFKLITPPEPQNRGGFVAFEVSQAHQWTLQLKELGIWTDARGDALRFGPAPYLTFDELQLIYLSIIIISRYLIILSVKRNNDEN